MEDSQAGIRASDVARDARVCRDRYELIANRENLARFLPYREVLTPLFALGTSRYP